MATKVIGLGAGGHARVVIEILKTDSHYELCGLLDPDQRLHGTNVLGVPVLGGDGLLPTLKQEGISHFFVGLGGSKDTRPRRRLFELALARGLKPVDAIHPRATISPSAVIGAGVTVMPGAVINACVSVGMNVIINTGAIVEHDCLVSDHVHIATGARLASTITVGAGAHIGAGATVKQGVTIGEGAVIGAGAAVVKDVAANTVVAGVPARTLPDCDGRSQ